MGKLTPEGQVLSKCKDMLKKLEMMGWVKHWDRISVGLHMNMQGYFQKHGKAGSPDLMAFVQCDEICHVLFLEVKSDVGKQSDIQKEFENKWIGLHNVIYTIITDHKQIKELVHNIRIKSKTYGKLAEWELPDLIV